MAVSNALGEKILMFSIRKSASPRCFKHIHNLPCKYQSQKKAWMDGTLFQKWLHKLDHKFQMQGRNVMIVNCPAHPEVSELKTINYSFCHKIPLPVHRRWIRG